MIMKMNNTQSLRGRSLSDMAPLRSPDPRSKISLSFTGFDLGLKMQPLSGPEPKIDRSKDPNYKVQKGKNLNLIA